VTNAQPFELTREFQLINDPKLLEFGGLGHDFLAMDLDGKG
jgi:hypothetical protein